ncbi:ABC1 family-domain-containing protein [Cristinia sonorae]|uniref:ABC1 family-domain-containing protein n=1 Tax=Cristinia sonorae TaxID=1940300 RepID=A0A8K0XND0_9AGAR|nr:ABC1 family-domain-containing protein [Cristinia sonorae]
MFRHTLDGTRTRQFSQLRRSLDVNRRIPHLRYSSIPHNQTPPRPRLTKWTSRLGYTSVIIGAGWLLDKEFNASAIGRNFRTFWTCAIIALDYKLNFTAEKTEDIPALHERVAERVYNLLTSNGGLYIKIGQAIGNNAALLPRPMQEKFAKLFDDAPQVSFTVVLKVFLAEFGRPPAGPDGVFEEFEERAAASASVAQVHRAKLKSPDGNGPWVAVKIQKPDVSKQVNWDLGAYRIVMWLYENYVFNLPVYFAVDFIADHLRRELDFEQEARNAQRTAQFVAQEPSLSSRVYIPQVYPEYTTKRVMTAEWIDGVRLSDRSGIFRLMGEDDPKASNTRSSRQPTFHPLKGGVQAVMSTMVDLFSAQIFKWGWVHCDPHPGNVIIRPHPQKPSYPQLVLIDHGLYVEMPETFRQQYATVWKGLLTADLGVIRRVTQEWGIGAPDIFASATLLKPVRFEKGSEARRKVEEWTNMTDYEKSVAMKEKLRGFLVNTDAMPKELIFIGRNMRIVQGNNQMFGSPVNRIRITGHWASRSLATDSQLTFGRRIQEYGRHLIFLSVMFAVDIAFWTSKLRQWFRRRMGWSSEGFEDELERTMRGIAKSNFGVDIAENAFEG